MTAETRWRETNPEEIARLTQAGHALPPTSSPTARPLQAFGPFAGHLELWRVGADGRRAERVARLARDESWATAYELAAAPEMRLALIEALELLELYGASAGCEPDCDCNLHTIRAALRRAEGLE